MLTQVHNASVRECSTGVSQLLISERHFEPPFNAFESHLRRGGMLVLFREQKELLITTLLYGACGRRGSCAHDEQSSAENVVIAVQLECRVPPGFFRNSNAMQFISKSETLDWPNQAKLCFHSIAISVSGRLMACKLNTAFLSPLARLILQSLLVEDAEATDSR